MPAFLARLGLRIPAALAAILTVAPAAGQTVPEIRIQPDTLYFGAAAAPPSAVTAEAMQAAPSPAPRREVPRELREKAAREGVVRVLVRLNLPFTPEGGLASVQVRDQRQAVARLQDTVLQRLAGANARPHARYRFIPYMALAVDAPALDRLARLPEVAAVEEDVFERPSLSSSTAVIGSGVAWAYGLTGAGKTIAVLDTGVDKTHPFFSSGPQNKVVSEACYSSAINGTISLCPGGATEATGPGTGASCTPSSDCRHGTHVAGIAAGNDGVGPHFGVARDADIIAIQVFSADCGGFCIGAWVSDQIKGLERVYELADDFDIAAVNMSLGGGFYFSRASCDASNSARKAAIDNLRSIDIATVAASGNDYGDGYIAAPACISSAVGVGATRDDDSFAEFSNVASFLDLMAPGVSVTSSVPGGGLATLDGTSMATPHVAGAWAVLKQAHPTATVSDILALLRNTAVPVSSFGYNLRRINLGKAAAAGPLLARDFTIHNDGSGVLAVLGMQLESAASWIRWTPEAPFDVPPGGSRVVSVSVDFAAAPAGTSMNRLIVTSTDADESPYPGAVHLVIGNEPCYPLERTHTGFGSHPMATPVSAPGCPPGQFRAGDVIQLTALPGTGSGVAGWSGTANDASTAVTNSATMPAGAHAVSVTYVATCFPLTLTHTGSGANPVATPGSSAGCAAGHYHYNEQIALSASPTLGWRVGGWTGTAADASRALTNSLKMPAAARTVSVTYLEGLPSVLFVDEYGSTTFRSLYTGALTAAGRAYDVWDSLASGSPNAATLAAYPRVIWYSGPYTGPGSASEATLATYLDQGGSLLISAQDYLFDRGFTSFIQDYLGVAFANEDDSYPGVVGQGVFGGLGPYELSFSLFTNWADLIYPGAGAETVFTAGGGSAGVRKIGPGYRTIFLGFNLEALTTAEGRRDVLEAAMDDLGTVFADVERGHWAKKFIEAMYRNGVTSGCGLNPRIYCPTTQVTREQMAYFLLFAKEGPAYAPPPCVTAPFNDVPVASPLCPWVKELVARGVTGGCGDGNFCPQAVVTREQAAVFLLKTLEGPAYNPSACAAAAFNDVPMSSSFCPWVKELVARGITGGCGDGNYCPSNPIDRAQMAVFLVTNFRLPIF
ncbi:MAG TPA: S8 family serine peptidase [Thermoanaerobaculia bacterium]